jgi:hypothetical protein
MKKLVSPLLLILVCQVQTASATAPDQKQVAALIAKLGSDSFSEREQAARDLEKAGPAALDSLRAALKHRDAEISGRAARLLASIEEQIVTAQMLAPKKFRLVVNNVSVADAIKEFDKLSGYPPCQLVGNLAGLDQRKITLDTGEVTFWEALQQLCQKGGLTESTTTANVPTRKVGNKVYYNNNFQAMPRTTILLMDGEAKQLPVCNQGSVRVLALPGDRTGSGEVQIMLDVAAEYRLQDFGVIGTPFLTKIVDDQAQTLAMVLPEPAADAFTSNTIVNGNVMVVVNVNGRFVTANNPPVVPQRNVAVRIKLGSKGARTLTEVSGKVTVQALTAPELLVKAEGILDAAGRTFMGKDGNGIHVRSVDKQTDGSYRIRLAIENPELQDPYAGRNVRIRNVNINNSNIPYSIQSNMPKMVDADGKEYAAEIFQQGAEYSANGQFMLNADLVYRPTAEPARLLLHGQRTILFTVPFTLKNVPIS